MPVPNHCRIWVGPFRLFLFSILQTRTSIWVVFGEVKGEQKCKYRFYFIWVDIEVAHHTFPIFFPYIRAKLNWSVKSSIYLYEFLMFLFQGTARFVSTVKDIRVFISYCTWAQIATGSNTISGIHNIIFYEALRSSSTYRHQFLRLVHSRKRWPQLYSLI